MCTYHAHKLEMFTKNSEKNHTYSSNPTSTKWINFYFKITKNEGAIKKIKSSDKSKMINLS
jgi:hypothetical protein